MKGTKDGRADGRRRLYGFAKTNPAALALGVTLCGPSVLAKAPRQSLNRLRIRRTHRAKNGLSGLLLPREPRAGFDVFRADSRFGVATAKEISYVKDARFVRFSHRFRWRPRSRRGPDGQRTVNRTLGRGLVAFDRP